jgi:RimJ/RimL family protein N-acetyltransferase
MDNPIRKETILHEKIYHADSCYENEIGYIQLVRIDDFSVPTIEYYIDKPYRRKGLMSVSLANFVKNLKGYKGLVALVKKNNRASQKLLEKTGFMKIHSFNDGDIESWVIYLGGK